MAWTSGLLYFFSRLPQILDNHKNKSVAGLSMWLIFITVWANATYGLSILGRWDELSWDKVWQSTLPYLIGSVFTFVFDIVITWQVCTCDGGSDEDDEVAI